MPYLLPLFPAPAYSPGLRSLPLAPPTPGQLNPGPSFTPSPAFSRRRRPTPSLPLPITQHPATSETKNPATHCMTGIDGGSAGIRTRGGLHHTAFRVLHLRPLGHATLPGYSTTPSPRARKSTGRAGSRATQQSRSRATPQPTTRATQPQDHTPHMKRTQPHRLD